MYLNNQSVRDPISEGSLESRTSLNTDPNVTAVEKCLDIIFCTGNKLGLSHEGPPGHQKGNAEGYTLID